MTFQQIPEQASKLSQHERAELASWLLRSLESPVYDVSDEEVAARMREAEVDPSLMITFEALTSQLRHPR